ncbi:MAG TPA: hypothetical protein PLU58_06555 [Saprospiraceae bacterium]|nr:hypothetical protein [Saprospiraceae bacterium]
MVTQYDDLMFRIDLIPQGEDLLKAFPRLSKYPEFNPEMTDIDMVIRYIVFCYDKGSPFHKFDNLGQKKAHAAIEAGFNYTDEKFEPHIEQMLNGEVLEVNKMIIRYCRMQSSRLYSLIVSGNEAFYDATSKLLDNAPSDDILKDTKTKMEIFDKAKANASSLDQMSRELLSGDNNKNIQKTLYVIVDNEEVDVKLTPEDFAL